jgi:drug/metabolite transporter (DMT)-like permease
MPATRGALAVLICTLCYGTSLLANGDLASAFGAPQLCVIVGASRCLVLLLLTALAAPGAPPLPLSARSLFPVLVVFGGNLGLYFFALLREAPGERSSALCGMVSVYCVIPVFFGALRGESMRPPKLLGVALLLSSTLLLGLSSPGAAEGGSGGALLLGPGAPRRVALFLAAVGCWGLCDVGSSRLARDAPLAHTALLGAVGQAAFAAAFALGGAAGGGGAPAPAAASVAWLALANVVGVVGWLAFVAAGKGGDVSAIAPLTSLYVFVPVLASAAGGEALPRAQLAGMALAAAGAVLVGLELGGGAGAAAAPGAGGPPPPPPLKPLVAVPDAEAGRREWEDGRRTPRVGGGATPRAGGGATPRQRAAAAAAAAAAAGAPLLSPPHA